MGLVVVGVVVLGVVVVGVVVVGLVVMGVVVVGVVVVGLVVVGVVLEKELNIHTFYNYDIFNCLSILFYQKSGRRRGGADLKKSGCLLEDFCNM